VSLVLQVTGLDRLENGEAARLILDRHGAMIGRSAHADWSLPDSRNYISSQHCEIVYRDGGYLLLDRSTNGTYVNRSPQRVDGPHRITDGDVITIGQYEIVARLQGDGAQTAPRAASQPQWGGWDSHVPAGPVGVDPASWDRPAPQPAISGLGPLSQNWTPPTTEPAAPQSPAASAWAQPEPAPAAPSAWSSDPAAPAPRSAQDVWGQLAQQNDVDWARGGFGAPPPAPVSAPAPAAQAWGAPAATPPPEQRISPAASPAPAAGEWQAFAAAAGLQPGDIKASPAEALGVAGLLLRRLIAGMVVMLEARTRAKAQLGAQGTGLELEGNNPLKFARTPERALAQLLNPTERGFLPAERAVEDSFQDLQAHQMATLAAMQGALAATLARFSPASIRSRAESKGVFAKILPGARDAALWQAYEREFEGVARGSDEAFMDVFAKEFRQAYDEAAAKMKSKPR
jgi:type VI secretion system FHA domain protein